MGLSAPWTTAFMPYFKCLLLKKSDEVAGFKTLAAAKVLALVAEELTRSTSGTLSTASMFAACSSRFWSCKPPLH